MPTPSTTLLREGSETDDAVPDRSSVWMCPPFCVSGPVVLMVMAFAPNSVPPSAMPPEPAERLISSGALTLPLMVSAPAAL